MKKLTWPVAIVISIVSLIGSATVSATPVSVHVPGTSVTMSPPDGFVVAKQFSGFVEPKTNSSILIAELPKAAYVQLSPVFSNLELAKRALAERGIEVTRLLQVKQGNVSQPVLVGVQKIQGTDVGKYLALFPGDFSVMLTYNIIPADSISEDKLGASIASVSIGNAVTVREKAEQLAFTLDAVPPFQLTDVLAGSSVVLTTFDGVDKTGKKPLITMGHSLVASSIRSPDLFSEQLLNSVAGYEKAVVISTKHTTFAGLKGYRIEAVNNDRTIIQYTGFDQSGQYWRLIATGSTEALAKISDEIQRVALSVKRR
ncbi:hypothetical protein L4174_020195 [Photobacterium sp. CCB-ST2H9]|uniref:hypothetical protein n=1 Tax=Photobacterium sp. CCB-ST2H9 TaxID=2912855 RepID=UPI0020062BBE|nr:hypothetical protein [Photobacterium sp. CCB-ST2H9]UTM59039.1 hypothetical protein L4174_020195 [Photobacterium sp. CCB-ST2H9]